MDIQQLVDQLREFDFNDVDWSRMGVWPLAARLLVCVALSLVIVAVAYFLFVKDMNVQLQAVLAREPQLKASFEQKAFQASNLDAYREQMVEMEASFGALIGQLPSDTEVPGLLEDIDEKGADSGLVIESIDLKPEQTSEFYVELPISIDVKGTYHDLGSFVSGIAGMPRIVTLHDYSVKKDSDRGLLSMNILAKTYRYKGQEE